MFSLHFFYSLKSQALLSQTPFRSSTVFDLPPSPSEEVKKRTSSRLVQMVSLKADVQGLLSLSESPFSLLISSPDMPCQCLLISIVFV